MENNLTLTQFLNNLSTKQFGNINKTIKERAKYNSNKINNEEYVNGYINGAKYQKEKDIIEGKKFIRNLFLALSVRGIKFQENIVKEYQKQYEMNLKKEFC